MLCELLMWLAEFMTQGLNEMFLKILRVKWNVLKVYSLNETYPTYQKKKKMEHIQNSKI